MPARRRAFGRAARILLGAFAAAVFFRGCIAEPFRIPTASMARTLLAGDYVLVTKYEYGARLPITVGVPLTDVYWHRVELPYVRLPGLRPPRRGDVAVFNYPLGAAPVDRRQPYVKRLVGLPGDTVALVRKTLVVNSVPVALPPRAQQRWMARLRPSQPVPRAALEKLNLKPLGIRRGAFLFDAPAALADSVRAWPGVASVARYVQPRAALRPLLFPGTTQYTRDDFGPLRVPRRGDTLALDTQTWPLYRDLLRRYERRRVVEQAGAFTVDGRPATYIVVGQDYFFTLGDNRDNSEDSRTWGFVPADHLIGRAWLVYYSWDDVARRVRGSRVFRRVR